MLIRHSEALDTADDQFHPEFVERDWDDDAFYDYYRDAYETFLDAMPTEPYDT
ncbi:hypothetical protein Acor_74650 [Acrocarpospora corrugata]|uniref:Uncharacterized protein n=1 Tax=Acrocarpospora corrugata TaxID=35763 RepID=A0A5M3W8J7_9ACTN|nr:hypothetical protein [Acrocarpospora corrugata]GES05397.1 hypothetical protein Acor_74650 [Acrocarpospora corrugata]